MQIILYQPEIPQNTGNIVRTCSATGASLVLIPPLGFSLSNRKLKRAGLDYWQEVPISLETDLEMFLENSSKPFYFFSSKAKHSYSDIRFEPNSQLIFGSETHGLPTSIHHRWENRFYRIPMLSQARCLNLANSVAIVLYEALRQQNFAHLITQFAP